MNTAKEYLFITIGVILTAVSAEFFLSPNNIAAGGVFGAAMIINHFFPSLAIGFLMLIMNVVLFIAAFIIIGNKFGGKTIYASITFSGSIWVLEKVLPTGISVTNNLFLASVFGTLISALGMAIVFNQNASTGGTDILAKIINKFVSMDIGKALLAVDFIITLFAAVYLGAEVGMFALLCVIMNGFVIDAVIEGLNISKQVMVISEKNEIIGKFITDALGRGCTLLEGKGGYTGNKHQVLYTVLGRKEFIRLKKYIRETDRNAFITVNEVHEVFGEGFNLM
ncbi:MAG: YitT family protein [Solirubrobacterales bacterium]